MPNRTDIADLIEKIAAAEDALAETEKAYNHAMEHWINRIHPKRRYKLNQIKVSVRHQRAALQIHKDIVANFMRRDAIH